MRPYFDGPYFALHGVAAHACKRRPPAHAFESQKRQEAQPCTPGGRLVGIEGLNSHLALNTFPASSSTKNAAVCFATDSMVGWSACSDMHARARAPRHRELRAATAAKPRYGDRLETQWHEEVKHTRRRRATKSKRCRRKRQRNSNSRISTQRTRNRCCVGLLKGPQKSSNSFSGDPRGRWVIRRRRLCNV